MHVRVPLTTAPTTYHRCPCQTRALHQAGKGKSKSGGATGESDLGTQGLPAACRAELAEALHLRLGGCHPRAPASERERTDHRDATCPLVARGRAFSVDESSSQKQKVEKRGTKLKLLACLKAGCRATIRRRRRRRTRNACTTAGCCWACWRRVSSSSAFRCRSCPIYLGAGSRFRACLLQPQQLQGRGSAMISERQSGRARLVVLCMLFSPAATALAAL